MSSNGKKLKEFRKVNGLTTKGLGEIIGMSGTSISVWECGGRAIPKNIVERLNKEFDLNLKYGSVKKSAKSNSEILKSFRKSSSISIDSLCSDINKARRTYYNYEEGVSPIPADVVETLNSLYDLGLKTPKSTKKVTKTTKSVKTTKKTSKKTTKKVTFGDRIKAIRNALGMTLKQFGDRYNASASHVYQWEAGKGKFVSLQTIKSLKKDGYEISELV